jgi:hypothetical protein
VASGWLRQPPSTSEQPASHHAHISALLSNSQLAGWSIDRIQQLVFAATLTNVCAHLLARPAMAGCAHHHCTVILFIMAKIVHETIKVIIIICSEVWRVFLLSPCSLDIWFLSSYSVSVTHDEMTIPLIRSIIRSLTHPNITYTWQTQLYCKLIDNLPLKWMFT